MCSNADISFISLKTCVTAEFLSRLSEFMIFLQFSQGPMPVFSSHSSMKLSFLEVFCLNFKNPGGGLNIFCKSSGVVFSESILFKLLKIDQDYNRFKI